MLSNINEQEANKQKEIMNRLKVRLEKVAKEKGYDIDKPRNLAKSVTVE